MLVIARRLRPISRWISVLRPSALRRFRGDVLPGNMLYSAVTQPVGFSSCFFQGGTDSSMLAVQSTVVRPALMRTLPGADPVKCR